MTIYILVYVMSQNQTGYNISFENAFVNKSCIYHVIILNYVEEHHYFPVDSWNVSLCIIKMINVCVKMNVLMKSAVTYQSKTTLLLHYVSCKNNHVIKKRKLSQVSWDYVLPYKKLARPDDVKKVCTSV